MVRRERLRVLTGVLAMALAASACSTASGASAAGLTLRFPASTQSGGYPTPFGEVRAGVQMTTLIFDTLAFPDVTGQPKPWLARSWTESPDGRRWTFRLHKATFQDGTPLTSADVVFSFDYDLHGPGASTGAAQVSAQGLDYIQSVTAEGPETVVIHLRTPDAAFLADIAGEYGVFIIPKHIWSKVTDPIHFQGPRALVGSGPYELKHFDPTTGSYDFVANTHFYLGRPKVSQIEIVPAANPLVSFERGELDVASPPNTTGSPTSLVKSFSKRYRLLTAPGEFNEALFFNLAAGFPYNQTAFRQAIAYAVNRDDMLARLAGGRGTPGSAGGLGPDNPYLDRNLPSYPYDPARAKTLLDQVGLKTPPGGKFRTQPDGAPLVIPLLASSEDTQVAELVQQYLQAVGLRVQIDTVDQATSDAADAKGSYKMAVIHYGGLGGDPSFLAERFAVNSRSRSFTRVHGYDNPTFNALAREQATAVSTVRRRALLDQMQAILARDIPEFPLYFPEQLTFVNTQVFHGWHYTPGCPACGVGLSKRILVTGTAAAAPGP